MRQCDEQRQDGAIAFGLAPGFPGRRGWVRCFVHTLNLAARALLNQFDTKHSKEASIVEATALRIGRSGFESVHSEHFVDGLGVTTPSTRVTIAIRTYTPLGNLTHAIIPVTVQVRAAYSRF